jgi:Tol biopolymer transport system component
VQRLPFRTPWTPRVAADGWTVVHGSSGSGGSTLWTTDLRTGTSRQLTDGRDDANDPQWSPDGRLLAYSVQRPGGKRVVVRPAAGGPARTLAAADGNWFATDWLPNARALLATADRAGSFDVVVLPADGRPARPYAATSAHERAARISPDGRWVAYQSNESGRDEVYVDGYPTPGRRVRVSGDGGMHPVWSRDGRELFYWAGDRLVAARLTPGASGAPPAVARRTPLFRARYPDAVLAMYDVTPDGRFVLAAGPAVRDRLVVALDALGERR